MVEETISMEIVASGSDDGTRTYEVRRTLNGGGRKSLVIELYPTLAVGNASHMDNSTMHLMNHIDELDWQDVRIVNLYANVFEGKPRVTDLNDAESSLAYIKEILEEPDIAEYEIVIAWGSALLNHKTTMKLKLELLKAIKDRGLSDIVKCLVTDNLFVEENFGVHPLFLGLRHSKDEWYLVDYPIDEEMKRLKAELGDTSEEKTKGKRGRKKRVCEIEECA